MEENTPPQVRKTVSMSHRQLGVGVVGLVSAITMLTPIKAYFYTREEGVAQSREIADLKRSTADQFTELKRFIAAGQEEQVRRLERSNDKLVERIKETELRSNASEARLDRRMDNIELAYRLKTSKTNN